MIKRIVLIVGAIAILVALPPNYVSATAVGNRILTRPPGVSANAKYVNVIESDGWFDCSIDHARDVNVCRAWKTDGRLIAAGDYRLDGENRAANQRELRPSLALGTPSRPDLARIYLFDGDKIFGKTPVPVSKDGKPLERFEVAVSAP